MSDVTRVIEVPLTWNEHGSPILDAPPRAHVELTINAPSPSAPAARQVCLAGNREGLTALATWLLALAAPESHPDHQHFDNEVAFGFFHSEQGWELIVSRTDR